MTAVRSGAVAIAILISCLPPAFAAEPACSRGVNRTVFAIVIGSNSGEVKEHLRPLQYADDDGVRFYALITAMYPAANAVLLAPNDDAAIWAHFPEASRWRDSGRWLPPKVEVLRTTLKSMRQAALDLVAKHMGVDFYFIYAGHGGLLDDGRGGLFLKDGTFSRAELYTELVNALPGVTKHLIIDACHAEHIVTSRGRSNPDVEKFLKLEDIREQPEVGVVAASNPTGKVKEWDRYRGGVFAHEVISGLLGAADQDGDGCVTYRELVGFVRAANSGVVADAARIEVFGVAPFADQSYVVADWRGSQAKRVPIREPLSGHIWIEDGAFERWVETNKSPGQRLTVALLSEGPYVLSSRPPKKPPISLGTISPDGTLTPLGEQPRAGDGIEPNVGKILDLGLFEVTFGIEVLAGLGPPPWLPSTLAASDGSRGDPTGPEEKPKSRWWLWVLLGTLVVAVGGVAAYAWTRPPSCPGDANCGS